MTFGSIRQEHELLVRGVSAQKNGDLLKAEEYYRSVLQANIFNADAVHLLATLYAARGDYSLSAYWFRKALCLVPAERTFLDNFRQLRSRSNEPNGRIYGLVTAWLWSLRPDDVLIAYELAVSSHEQNRFRLRKLLKT